MPYDALEELLAFAGTARRDAARIEIVDRDPVFPTRFRVAAAGAAAIAAAAAEAASLWALRASRPPQKVTVDLRHAAAALRSARYLRIADAPPPKPFDPLSGFYATRTGWVFLHCNFPNHRQAALRVLGLAADASRDAVASAAQSWPSQALEDAVHAEGGCAAFVRSAEEWQRHPQATAVASQPLIAIERIGAAPPEPPSRAGDRPLSGLRVLDLTRVLAGPTCARTLAEHGADVLKISASHLPHSREIEIDAGLGKLSAFLDLRQPAELARLTALIRDGRCDVFSQSYRPGALAARGFGAEALAALRPGLIYVDLSAWGPAGPWATRRGFDTIVQCVSGMAMIEGDGDKPRIMRVSAIDYVSGYLMAWGAMIALERRALEGGSWRVRVSLARTGQWIAERGLIDAAEVADVPAELPKDEIARLCVTTPSLLGPIRHLRPVAQLLETPPFWARPPVPLGHDAPAWPPHGG
jgi:crotonobetainyl-CoA:carnitine CoA-transferase CaiB-like acyl-CoA transferase